MSSENTSINIIIPVYNRAKLITHTLDSVYNSGLKNVRIICIDDGSDDDSVKIIKAYQKSKENLILLENQHAGTSVARNSGIELCDDGYIAFLDSDDFLNNEVSNADIERAVTQGADIISFDYCVNNKIKNKFEFKEKTEYGYQRGTANVRCFDKHFSSFLFKSSLINFKKIRFYENIRHYEDALFRTLSLYHSVKTVHIPKKWFTYNKHYDSLSFNIEKMNETDHAIKAWDFAIDYFQTNFPQDKSILDYCNEKLEWVKQRIARGRQN